MNTLEAKVVILGSTGVGKTSVAVRYVQNTFTPNGSSTIGASFMTKKLSVDNCNVRLQLWDTAGQEKFRAMAPMYYRGASAGILVYDITSENSYLEMISWMDELKKNMSDELVLYVVGNKVDLESHRQVPLSRVVDYCKRAGIDVTGIQEVSAKTNDGIDNVFYDITVTLVNRLYHNDIQRINTSDVYNNEDTTSKSGCC
ncbi:ras-like GTP-binding protein RYL2 [Pilobolus umbonatus]|nr:ras-like GTP-binding protein RYL2 [Pilobolus umbonatus]